MRTVLQVVSHGKVEVAGLTIGECEYGMVLLVGIADDDTEMTATQMADRIAKVRIFPDDEGKLNLDLKSFRELKNVKLKGKSEILAISNFTVYGDVWTGRRPSFKKSAPFSKGLLLFNLLVQELQSLGFTVASGEFGANMEVTLTNIGPLTLVIDSNPV